MSDKIRPLVRCAIYTRKSSEEGLDQDFSSLDAQREACQAYVASQREEGWRVLPEAYDDGGFTGANMDRPALQRLLTAVEEGRIDCVVVYKADRLGRSIRDVLSMLEVFEKHGTSFVSITQQFNTTTSAGRMMLNMLLTFAQFEREMIAERTRDKMSAARRKGKWTGGNPVLGYDCSPQGGALVINEEEAARVREIYRLYLEFGSLIPLVAGMDSRGWTMKRWTTREGRSAGGARFNKGNLYNLLTNVLYTGRVKHGGQVYAGEQEAIVDDATWNCVQQKLSANGRRGGRNVRNKCGALLKGLVRCASCGVGMTHTWVRKKPNKIYRYYVCNQAHQRGWAQCPTRSVSAPLLEEAVVARLRTLARTPPVLSEVLQQIRKSSDSAPDPGPVREALERFDPVWEQLNGWERETMIAAIVQQVSYDGAAGQITVTFRSEHIAQMIQG
jgi:site-specific DNA recombinase